jgi:glycosyltransferase involved in cell wall biosynthesis
MQVLGRTLQAMGHEVSFDTPRRHLPVYTAERVWFNRSLRTSDHDLTVGFDMDGYHIAAGSPSHTAALKGVIADEVRFERGLTRFTMSMQAERERLHVRRAARVLVTSRYSAERAQEFYGLSETPPVVPELIDLAEWRRVLAENPARPSRFTVLFVGRLYRRKRVDVLLRAAATLRDVEVRIVGDGPCAPALRRLARHLHLDNVTWLGTVSRAKLAAEYNRATVFCLPSVQEGFGIVLLEAMAADKPIVAARAGAIPEVAPHGTLVDPDNPEALAAGLAAPRSPTPAAWVEQFDAPRVAARFMDAAMGKTAIAYSSAGS